MVSLSEVKVANAALSKTQTTLTAVFVGATHGIGLATLQSFARHIPEPTAIVLGRDASRFAPELARLRALNPKGTFVFLETDVSLIANIDAVCAQIEQRTSRIDLLVQSQGYVGFAGREDNSDGLDNSVSLRYYGRIHFTKRLMPLLSKHARAVSILAGGQEGKVFEQDLDLKSNYSVANAAGQYATMTTLSFDRFAAQDPDKAFVHIFPGLVSTGLLGRSASGVLGVFFRWVVDPLLATFVAASPADAGERMLYAATDGHFAKGSWSLDWDCAVKEGDLLATYRRDGLAATVADHNEHVIQQSQTHHA